MLRSEAKAQVIKAAGPGRSVCLTVQDWHHVYEPGRTGADVEYRVSVLPGVNGEKCSQWDGKSLAAVVADAVADLTDPPALPTPTELDEHFEERPAVPTTRRVPALAGVRQADPTDPTDRDYTVDPAEIQF